LVAFGAVLLMDSLSGLESVKPLSTLPTVSTAAVQLTTCEDKNLMRPNHLLIEAAIFIAKDTLGLNNEEREAPHDVR
jgi:hypothetical protein